MKEKLLVFVATVVLILLFSAPFFLKVTRVICRNQFGECDQIAYSDLQKVNGISLIRSKKLIKEVLSNNLLVENYSQKFVFPDTIKIEVLERRPKFAVKKEKYFLVDAHGLVLEEADETALSYVTNYPEVISVGDKVDDKLLFALKIISELYLTYQTRSAVYGDEKLTIELTPDLNVIFPLRGDIKVLLGSLSLIMSRLNGTGKQSRIVDQDISEIDLRFENPVLR